MSTAMKNTVFVLVVLFILGNDAVQRTCERFKEAYFANKDPKK